MQQFFQKIWSTGTSDQALQPQQQLVREFLNAANHGKLEKVQECIRKGVNVESQYSDSLRAIHNASYNGHLQIVKYLVEQCHANAHAKNNNGTTALHFASRNGHLDVVKYLIQDCRVDVNTTKNNDGWTALHAASENGHLNVVKYFIQDCHVDVNTTKNNDRWTAFHSASRNGHLDVVKYFIQDCRIDVNTTKNNERWTALHSASEKGHLNVVKYLVETCYADITLTTSLGKTACQIAHDQGKNNIVEYLSEVEEHGKRNTTTETATYQSAESMVSGTKNSESDFEIVTDRKKMEDLMNDPTADPIILSLRYLELCTDNFTSKVLGSGAFGTVYFGCDKELGVQIAVKRIPIQIPDEQTFHEITLSFKREIAVLKRFRHPNIVVLYGYNALVKQNNQCLVYEYISNGSLAEFLKDERGRTRLPSSVRLSIMFQLARSVHFLHTGGCDNLTVFHRDIKSGNICLTQDYTAKLIDCGLAKFVPDNNRDSQQGSMSPTMLKSSGAAVFGTPGYICPVYARGQSPYTAACDVYSMGVVFAELLTGSMQGGQSSLSGKSLGDFFGRYIKDEDEELVKDGWKIMEQEADMVAQWSDDILERLCRLTVQCMAAAPRRRISTLELVQNLSEISSKDFSSSGDNGSESVVPDSIDYQQLTIYGVTDVGSKSNAKESIDSTSDLYYHCVLCNRSTCRTISCVDGHRTCVQCVEQAIQVHIGKSGDSLRCKCGALIHDDALFGKISLPTYNCYIRERSLQKAIEDKFDGMKLHLHRISSMSEQNHQQVMSSLKGISSNVQRVLGGLAYVATNSVQQCPTVVWLVPADPTAGNSVTAWKQWARNLTHKKYDLYFVCQHSFEVVEDKMTITVPRSWLTQAAPALYLSMILLKTALTIGGLPALPFPIPSVLSRADQITMNEEFVTALLENAATMRLVEAFKAAYTQGLDLPYSESSQLFALTGASYEGIVAKATSMKRCHWKQSMEPVTNHRGSIIWVKKEYRDFY